MKLAPILLAAAVATGFAATDAAAKSDDPILCNLRADYLINRTLRAPFLHTFTIQPGASYDYDFSNVIRQRYLNASAEQDPVTGVTTVSINLFQDTSAFNFIELITAVRVTNHKDAFASQGKSTFFTTLGTAGEHTTDWELNCIVDKL